MADDTQLKMEIFSVLSHPIRRKILELIEKEKEVSYTQLTETFELKSGPLYHHLRKMGQFVYQREDKKYCLTEEGLKAIAMLQGVDGPSFEDLGTLVKPKIIQIGKVSLAPFIKFFSKNPYHVYIEFIIFAAISGYLGATNKILIVGNFVLNFEISLVLAYVSMFASWIFLAIVSEVLSRLFYKKKENTVALFGVTSLIFLPSFIFILVVWLTGLIMGTTIVVPTIVLLILHGIFQIWSFLVIATALGVLKELSLEKSALIALIGNYIQIFSVIFIMLT
ncbi:MAG: helix-turn-helix transcriptional regulator [Candidatus Heimdallarchaeota archaeon]|nr:helix-turn-helix transcriptional regulator [Candidatus Heimdallarchaeota archaeon]MCK4770552.1 helix-turn-helix transcriptional regulator [Candidatus Heimdallarchaeota archaeon]